MRFLPAIIANFVLLVSALGYGSVLLRFFPLSQTFSEIDRRALTLLAGLGLLGTAFFDIGQILLFA